ncbi:MAG: ion transporter [Candidatus Handelsmanbacteria bacterium]|nr:ion transporter [Candidatus Handelsmanbacteria bacterium]
MLRKVAAARWFQNGVTLVILFAGVLVGVETNAEFAAAHHGVLLFLDRLILGIFTLEMLIKMGAEGRRPWNCFGDPWNVFDFLIVAVCYLPIHSQYVTVLRLLRLLRVLRLVRALPRMQLLVAALFKSIPSMVYVAGLMMLLFYVYAVAGVFVFGKNDPIHFSSLGRAMLSLFGVVTLEGWVELMNIQIYGCDRYGYGEFPELCTSPLAMPAAGIGYFVSFVLLGTMVVLNLFIGVIMNGMEEAQRERQQEQQDRLGVGSLAAELAAAREQVARLDEALGNLEARAGQAGSEARPR